VTTLKEFENALREQAIAMALAILEKLRERVRATRTIRPARRISELNRTTEMTQQEIVFQLGINQGRANEVLKRGKWHAEQPEL
jgi:hypothetical protein